MGAEIKQDFASLLDELLAADRDLASGPAPTVPFDYLSVAEELHSGRIKVSAEAVTAEYRETAAVPEAELEALLAATTLIQETDPADDLPVEPEAISRELGLTNASAPAELARLRRAFAFKNHPDRVAPHLRQRAMLRMQVANMLIDEAKRRAVAFSVSR